jgi:ketosteroid isomerase-like protein
VLPALIPIVVAACGGAEPTAEAVLLQADSAFARETATGGADAWTSWFDTVGVMVTANRDIRGHADIRAAMGPTLSDSTIRFTWSPEWAIAGEGDLGTTVGSYRVESRGEVVERGRYLTVWRRQSDGSWKVVADIGSSSPDGQ